MFQRAVRKSDNPPVTRGLVDTIRKRIENLPPGPWFWHGNTDVHNQMLARIDEEGHTGVNVVMSFVRDGMQGAQPVFWDLDEDGRNWNPKIGKEVAIYQVAPLAESRKDPAVYRADIIGYRSGIATFLADARQNVEDLLQYIDQIEKERDAYRDIAIDLADDMRVSLGYDSDMDRAQERVDQRMKEVTEG